MSDELHFCAPADFGAWHITADGEETLCGDYEVEGHHLSGTVEEYDPHPTDCAECWDAYERGER